MRISAGERIRLKRDMTVLRCCNGAGAFPLTRTPDTDLPPHWRRLRAPENPWSGKVVSR